MALSLTACASTPSTSAAPAPAGNTAAGTDAPAAATDDGQTYVINIGHINDERDSWHLGSE
ncbi:C4-dicarboxylate ABC transporter, partial [Enterocloster aldensis]|nr:C4-dicarboxylate ABC transporter [Enterocloster aldenensis]